MCLCLMGRRHAMNSSLLKARLNRKQCSAKGLSCATFSAVRALNDVR
ncbi:Unknown protein sequence [Pseudomonas syringae pv. cilantro]|uniref:Uncharacterized protein n=1 Tax=Pseudomonas syringae pv. cilantro TaxID=81035 RepID=A0A0N0GDB2_PSESX|nr:Unknown protein sequence [Pseudomonas syringae pv. cilantro]KPW80442.1 Unknown protein sequence [Pseudomonas syringae pv. coriandricola]